MAPDSYLAPDRLFAQASLASARALPNTRLAASTDAGWTALLLEHHRSQGRSEAFTTLATPDQTIVIAIDGDHEIECLSGGRWRKAIYRPGSGGMTPGGDSARLRWRSRGADAFTTAHLYLPQWHFQDAGEYFRRAGQGARGAGLNALAFKDAMVAQAVRALLSAMKGGAPDLYAQAAAQWLAVHILSRQVGWIDVDGDRRSPGQLSDRRLARVVEYMSAHLAKPLSLEELAAEAAVSKFHFVRLFRRKTGSTPHAYLLQLRIAAARRMLAITDLPVAEVGRACGFASASHFGSAFLKAEGATPSRFRRAMQGVAPLIDGA